MPTLHLGVLDLPYTAPPPASNRPSKGRPPVSTFEVAGWLENRYHVMEHFLQLHGPEIANDLANGMIGVLQTVAMGGTVGSGATLLTGAQQNIETSFRRMIDMRELDSLGYPGIPTKAAQDGRRTSFKKKRGAPRASFFDTGLFANSFRAWMS